MKCGLWSLRECCPIFAVDPQLLSCNVYATDTKSLEHVAPAQHGEDAMKTFSLPQLATELSMSQKAVRAKLRKAGYERPGTRWVWPTDMKAEIRAIAKGKKPAPVVAVKKSTKKPVVEKHVAAMH
jgi:hypothetical protein